MQYPIIDLITNAYINNGWTGLNVIMGKNLFDSSLFVNPSSDIQNIYLTLKPNTRYTMSTNMPLDPGSNSSMVFFLLSNESISTSRNGVYVNRAKAVTTGSDGIVKISYRQYDIPIENYHWMIEEGGSATAYEPYVPPTTDIAHRLKLPLPNYFPHPVIDSLKRASDGTMTNKDKEILTHYLTPLGIGGI